MTSIDIAIPIYNEEDTIEDCLDSVLSFDNQDEHNIQIYIIDGGSSDKSLELIKKYTTKFDNISLIHNEKKIAASALNLAIEQGNGEYLMRLDAGNIFDKDYLNKCIKTSLNHNAENVGGFLEIKAKSNSFSSLVTQILMSHPFSVGNSTYRTSSDLKEISVDTVPYGFFKKSIFKKIGKFNEKLERAQDYEFNSRIIASGGKIILNPSIRATYFSMSLSKHLKKIFFLDAPYNAYMWKLNPQSFSLRHSITLFFMMGVIGGVILSPLDYFIRLIFLSVIGLYFFLALLVSISSSFKFKNIFLLCALPFCFFSYHFLHGLGILIGLTKMIFKKSPLDN